MGSRAASEPLLATVSDLDPTVVAALLGVALLVLWRTLRPARQRGSRRPSTRRTTRTQPLVGDVWWADVPFEDGTGSKDRPCVVVETHGLRPVVLYVTSTDKAGRPGWLAMPRQGWSPKPGTSWLRTDRRVALDPHRMRRYAGPCPPSVRKALGV